MTAAEISVVFILVSSVDLNKSKSHGVALCKLTLNEKDSAQSLRETNKQTNKPKKNNKQKISKPTKEKWKQQMIRSGIITSKNWR